MAQGGDTITYTYSDGTSVAEDVSDIDEMTVEYLDAAGGQSSGSDGGNGGRVENAVIDVSTFDTIYIWVSNAPNGRYDGVASFIGNGAGSTEIATVNTTAEDSEDEPFLVGAGGGGSGGDSSSYRDDPGGAGAREGYVFGEGVAPPSGGDRGGDENDDGDAGDGAVDDQNRGYIKDSGTTIEGGGSPQDTAGEVKISYKLALSPPDPPSNLSAEVQ